MVKELPKTYEPQKYEDEIYKKWEESGYFNPDNLDLPDSAEPYCISMPPPNVTGVLHLGHALENSIMDAEARFQRMSGKKVLILPGTDHAAVATQAKVEKELIKEGIKNPRQELGREKLLKKIREYSEKSKATIIKQTKKMGTSCDWTRLAYTFDEQRCRAVNEVFTRMYNDGLIYKGYRVVNWSVKGQSTCSDDELVHIEKQAKLYTFKYASDFPIAISTTRPETKLGDTAVAVHPDDRRYKEHIGKTLTTDIGAEKPLEIKIIADESIDPEFGTGALGVTPAHSQIDYEMYERHKLELIAVIGSDGRMTAQAGKDYEGLTINEAREKFVSWLKSKDLMENEEEITHNVGTSDRFNDIIEVIPMEQWFINVNKKIPGRGKSLKDLMREAVRVGHGGDKKKIITITPERFNNQYFHWIDNLRDWCISRQIWWGHRIPVWYKENNIYVGIKPPQGGGWIQDEDTLDTWFSSGLWTFSTLGWPEKTDDLKTYHPTAWMQMGYEILFFWMARMILMSAYALDDIPFKDVYIHGMLRDKDGQKFSKSLGTGIDPMEMCDKYGTDALRLSLILGITPGNDSKFYDEKIEGARNFVNKLWNISRYILQTTDDGRQMTEINLENLTVADRWILANFNTLIDVNTTSVTKYLNHYEFLFAVIILQTFTQDFFADWYLEISKFEKSKEKNKILFYILKNLLKLWHPFVPFVTEAIWQEMGEKKLLMVESWPNDLIDCENDRDFELIKNIITVIRNARAENKVEPGRKINAVIYAGDDKNLIESQAKLIKSLKTGIKDLKIEKNGKKIENAIFIPFNENIEIYLLGAVNKEREEKRIKKEIENKEKLIAGTEKKLANKNFTEKAPKAIVGRQRENLKNWQEELKKLNEQLESLSNR